MPASTTMTSHLSGCNHHVTSQRDFTVEGSVFITYLRSAVAILFTVTHTHSNTSTIRVMTSSLCFCVKRFRFTSAGNSALTSLHSGRSFCDVVRLALTRPRGASCHCLRRRISAHSVCPVGQTYVSSALYVSLYVFCKF